MEKLSSFLWRQNVDRVIHEIKQGRKPPFAEAEEPGPVAKKSLEQGEREVSDGE